MKNIYNPKTGIFTHTPIVFASYFCVQHLTKSNPKQFCRFTIRSAKMGKKRFFKHFVRNELKNVIFELIKKVFHSLILPLLQPALCHENSLLNTSSSN